jgi:hypothetical protein
VTDPANQRGPDPQRRHGEHDHLSVRVWAGLVATAALTGAGWFADRAAVLSLLTRPAVLGGVAGVAFCLEGPGAARRRLAARQAG